MTYDFYAAEEDKLLILDFIFNQTDLRVYDLSSAYGEEISEYKSTDEICSKFDLTNGDKYAITFQLWSPRHKGKPFFRKIDLDPKHCNGNTFRYSTDGWGLIQLYLGGIKFNKLHHSHIGHFTESGVQKWKNTNSFNGSVDSWDWSEIQSTSRKLKQYIRNKLTVGKMGHVDILPATNNLMHQGILLA